MSSVKMQTSKPQAQRLVFLFNQLTMVQLTIDNANEGEGSITAFRTANAQRPKTEDQRPKPGPRVPDVPFVPSVPNVPDVSGVSLVSQFHLVSVFHLVSETYASFKK